MPIGHFRCFSRAVSPQFDAETCSSDLSSLVSDNGSESEIESDNETSDIVCIKPKRCNHINDLPLEVIAHVRDYLSDTDDLRRFMRVQRSWYTLGVRRLWAKPAVLTPVRLDRLGDILSRDIVDDGSLTPLVGNLASHVRRLNLCHVSLHVNNADLLRFRRCCNLERLVLQNCQLVDPLALEKLLRDLPALISVDLQMMPQITDSVIEALTSTAQDLQVFYGGGMHLTNASIAMFRRVKPTLRRFRLTQSPLVALDQILGLAKECINLVELDLSNLERKLEVENMQDSRGQGLEPRDLKDILLRCPHLRELRLDKLVAQQPHNCDFSMFNSVFADNLRVLTLAVSPFLGDSELEYILPALPKLRHLNISKCPLISDRSLFLIAQAYNHGLHYLHLGHCYRITDRGIEAISEFCDRLTYFDAANCARLTNRSLGLLGKLPRLRRIGLVKCSEITGVGLLAFTSQALAILRNDTAATNAYNSNTNNGAERLALGPGDFDETGSTTSSAHDLPQRPLSTRFGQIPLERLHLSYCSNISMESVRNLLRVCPRLLHLSLTGVRDFMRNDILHLSRPPPSELHENQRQLFCVFSGQAVDGLRRYLQAADRYEQAQQLRPQPPLENPIVRVPPLNISHVLSLLEELDEVGNSVRDTIIWSSGFSDVDDRADVSAPANTHISGAMLPPLRPRTPPPLGPRPEDPTRLRAPRRRLPRPPETRSQRLMSIILETRERFTGTRHERTSAVEQEVVSSSEDLPTATEVWTSPSSSNPSLIPTAVDERATSEAHSPDIAILTSDHLWPEIGTNHRFAERPNIEAPYFERPSYEPPSRNASLSPADPSQSSSNHSSSTHLVENSLNERELADLLSVLRLRRATEPETTLHATSLPRRRRFSRL